MTSTYHKLDAMNTQNNKGKIAVITGSSEGIGRAIAIAFAKSKEYSGIVTNSRKIERAQSISEEIKLLDCDSIAIQADVSKESDCINLIDETIKKYDRIDVLVNNAGIQQDVPFEETSIEEWYKIIGVDLTGPFVCSREAVKHMKKQQDPTGGCIINISSVHQVIPKPHYVPYATSKAGIEMMTKTMALELAKDNIRVNLVAPGAIDTDMNTILRNNKSELENVLKLIPMGKVGSADDVANIVEFLASNKARYVTGASYFVDGGMTLYPSFGPNVEHNALNHNNKATIQK